LLYGKPGRQESNSEERQLASLTVYAILKRKCINRKESETSDEPEKEPKPGRKETTLKKKKSRRPRKRNKVKGSGGVYKMRKRRGATGDKVKWGNAKRGLSRNTNPENLHASGRERKKKGKEMRGGGKSEMGGG